MSTSNSTVWELTRDQIIESALYKLGVLNEGDTPSTHDLTRGQRALNGIIARFNTLGMPLWKRTETVVSLVLATPTYTQANFIKVPEVYLRNINSAVQYKLQLKSKYDLRSLPYSDTGMPVSWSYTPNLAEGGVVEVWPIPDQSAVDNYSLLVIGQKEFDTFTSANETPDFPAYWTDALIYALAVSLAPEKGIPLNDRKVLKDEANAYLGQAQSYGDEDGSIYFYPEKRY